MRFSPEQLKWMALVALDEIAASPEPVPKSYLLRFALAYLYAAGDGPKWIYDSFWKAATTPGPEMWSEYQRDLCRRQNMEASMNGMCRHAGWERTINVITQLEKDRGARREGS